MIGEGCSVIKSRLQFVTLFHFYQTDQAFFLTWNFAWKVFAITGVSCIPIVILKCIRMKLRPPIYSKLR